MADIWTVYGKVAPTGEPFTIDVEWEETAHLLSQILQQNPNIEDVEYTQRF